MSAATETRVLELEADLAQTKAVLKGALELFEHAKFDNGVTSPEGKHEAEYWADLWRATARAALAAVKPEEALNEELEITFNTAQEMVSVKEQNAALLKRCEEAESELKHFVAAKRFDRSVFDDDTAMVDWILSRARAALQRAETGGEA